MMEKSRQVMEELDAFISARLVDENLPAPAGVRQADADLASELVALSSAMHPDRHYVERLEAQLWQGAQLRFTPDLATSARYYRAAEGRVGQEGATSAAKVNTRRNPSRLVNRLAFRGAFSRGGGLRAPVSTAICMLLILVTIFSFPSIETLAQRIAQLFQEQAKELMTVVFVTPEAGQVHGPENLASPISISEAEALAGFDVKEPEMALPEGFVFRGAGYLPEREIDGLWYPPSVGLAYDFCDIEGCRPRGYEPLYITMYPWAADLSSLPQQLRAIHGPVYGVEFAQVRGVTGEYVRGWWDGIPLMPDFDDAEGMPTGEVSAIWNPELPFQVLRWQEDGFVFEVMNREDKPGYPAFLERDILFALAESLE